MQCSYDYTEQNRIFVCVYTQFKNMIISALRQYPQSPCEHFTPAKIWVLPPRLTDLYNSLSDRGLRACIRLWARVARPHMLRGSQLLTAVHVNALIVLFGWSPVNTSIDGTTWQMICSQLDGKVRISKVFSHLVIQLIRQKHPSAEDLLLVLVDFDCEVNIFCAHQKGDTNNDWRINWQSQMIIRCSSKKERRKTWPLCHCDPRWMNPRCSRLCCREIVLIS